jgi:hypothetical protein
MALADVGGFISSIADSHHQVSDNMVFYVVLTWRPG